MRRQKPRRCGTPIKVIIFLDVYHFWCLALDPSSRGPPTLRGAPGVSTRAGTRGARHEFSWDQLPDFPCWVGQAGALARWGSSAWSVACDTGNLGPGRKHNFFETHCCPPERCYNSISITVKGAHRPHSWEVGY